MELQKGTCFLCCNTKVIKPSQSQKAYKIITALLPKEILNPVEFEKVQSNVKFCPICYHKLVVIKHAYKNVEAAKSAETAISNEVSTNTCQLCNSLKNLLHIKNWPHFNTISEGNFSKNTKCLICSECFFYLEIKNILKTKLLSQYPRLGAQRVNNRENKRNWKLKFTPDIRLQSTPVSDRKVKSTRKRKFAEMVESPSSAEDSLTRKNINFDSIKKFKPLKEQESLKYDNLIKGDSKFVNQIPYVLVSSSHSSNAYSCIINEKCNVKRKSNKTYTNNINETTDIFTTENIENINKMHGIKKKLVINLVRMDIEQYQQKDDVKSDVQNPIDKSESSPSSNEAEESISAESSNHTLTETPNKIIEEPETSFEIKNKRKSVSFAEEKNVEIEYFESDEDIEFSASLENDINEIVRKQSRGILKRDENTKQNLKEPENQNEDFKGFDENGETVDLSNNKETEIKENGQEEVSKVAATTNKIRARRNTHFVTERNIEENENDSSDSENENLLEVLRKSEKSPIYVMEHEKESNNIEKKNNVVIEVISDDNDTDIKSSVNDHNADKLKMSNNKETPDGELVDNETILEEDKHDISKQSVDNEELKNNSYVKVIVEPALKKNKININDLENEKEEISPQNDAGGKKDEENLDISEEIDNNVSSVIAKGNNELVETHTDNNSHTESSLDGTIDKPEEENENVSVIKSKVISYEEEISSKSVSEDEIVIVQNIEISEYSEEVLNEDVTNNEKRKRESLPDNEVSRLVNKYLNTEDDNSSFINIEKKDAMLKSVTDDSFTNDECSEIRKKMDSIPTSSFSDFDKHEESLGLSEDDNENINSLLSHILSPELPDDRILFETKNDNNEDDSGDDVKRKNSDELNLSREKKKKKVTFSEDIT